MQYPRLLNCCRHHTAETHVVTDQDLQENIKNYLLFGILLNSMQFYSMEIKMKITSKDPNWLKKSRGDTVLSLKDDDSSKTERSEKIQTFLLSGA